MCELLELVKHIADTDVPVLILGETGTGKELFAQALHEHSSRQGRLLVTLNCAAIPDNLVESELFGHEKGAFSGAAAAKAGLFEAAHGSTLFLDEVGELPRTTQAKLLRVLETKEVLRLGALRPLQVDTRVVAATNRDVQAEIAAGNFRADLYYRLNGISLRIPPLRERRDEIPPLAQFFAGRCGASGQMFSAEAMSRLLRYDWPGNVRELRSVVERAVLLARGGVVEPSHLVFDPRPAAQRRSEPGSASHSDIPPSSTFGAREMPTGAVAAKLQRELDRRERRRIVGALEQAGGNQKDAAQILGISRRTLITRMEQYDIPRPRKRRA
jgi:transcriptional regulator with GAF, ATPase, and Fis domain